MASVDEVLNRLKTKARPDQLEGMARYGMAVERRLGISVPDMRKLAKEFFTLSIVFWYNTSSSSSLIPCRLMYLLKNLLTSLAIFFAHMPT